MTCTSNLDTGDSVQGLINPQSCLLLPQVADMGCTLHLECLLTILLWTIAGYAVWRVPQSISVIQPYDYN